MQVIDFLMKVSKTIDFTTKRAGKRVLPQSDS